MGAMFTAFFAFVVKLFTAAEKVASAADNLATWADEASGTFADVARHERNEKVKAMMKAANLTALPEKGKKPQLEAPAA